MNTLKDFILRHAASFNGEEPPRDHMERFSRKLDAIQMKAVHKNPIWLQIAAVLLVGFLISYVTLKGSRMVENQIIKFSTYHTNNELKEAENFYSVQLGIYYNKIQDLHFNNDQAEKKQVLSELSAMDEQVKVMKHDLEQNPDDERIVHAIINFYQVKIELMNVIIDRAQQAGTIL